MLVMVIVSAQVRRAAWAKRAEGVKFYEQARAAGLHPTVYSALINNIRPIEPGDERVKRIAEVVGVPVTEAFTKRGAR